jgi:hypothetical protein
METTARRGLLAGLTVTAGLMVSVVSAPAAPATFDEVISLVQSNLAGSTAADLDQRAVAGLLSELSPRVALVQDADAPVPTALPQGVVENALYRDSVGYVRLGVITKETAGQLRSCYQELRTSNELSGFVLDLRLSTGQDYAAAVQVAEEFLRDIVPLMNWGEGLKSSTGRAEAITLPVAVLVNGETGGSAEALAGMLRQSGVALLIGGRTAGTAGIQEVFPLSNGQLLRITVANVQLGDAEMITPQGLPPDVRVETRPEVETALFNGDSGPTDDASSEQELQTNDAPGRLRMNEADLVRRWRGEMLSEEDFEIPAAASAPESRDPVLLRALDLMDGLAILRSWHD